MDLLTPELRAKLIANAAAHTQAMQHGLPEPDPAPVVKFFNPCGAATWLFSELDSDGDTLFGLCDLGFGCPELGSASLAEVASVTVALGLKIERDRHFTATFPLSVYAEAARQHGGIVENDAALAEAAMRLARERTRLIVARNLLDTLRECELAGAAEAISTRTGLPRHATKEGDSISGIYRERITLASGRFAMIDDGMGFALVPWRPALNKHLGEHVMGTVKPGGGIDWSLGRSRSRSLGI